MKRTGSFLVVLALSQAVPMRLRAEDNVPRRLPAREVLVTAVRSTGYQVSCGAAGLLGLCGMSRPRARAYQLEPGRDTYEYNAIQRLAGMIADRMEAGTWKNLKLRFKIILE